jgi:YVTN family beta-propeller protein
VGVPVVQAGIDPIDPLDPLAEPGGFEAFYLREYHAVVRLAYALSGSRLAAEDIAQEAFLQAFRDWERIRHPSAWVRKVVVRRAGRTAHRRLLEAMSPTPRWPRSPRPSAWPRERSRPSSTAPARPWPPGSPPPGRTIMLEERLRSAARALERSVVEVDAVWVSRRSDGAVARIDPATNQVVATIPVGRAPGAMTVAGGVVWVALPGGGLGRIDPAGSRSTVVPVPRCCAGELAAGEGALWVANRGDGTLVRVDPGTGRVAARVLLPRTTGQRPHQVAVGEGAVWVTSASPRRGTANLLWRVDPASSQVTGTLDLGPTSAGGIPNSVAAGNGAVWVGGATKGAIVRLAPS